MAVAPKIANSGTKRITICALFWNTELVHITNKLIEHVKQHKMVYNIGLS